MIVGIAAQRRPLWPKWDWIEKSIQSQGHQTVRITTLKELREADCDVVLFDHREPGMGRKEIVKLEHKAVFCTWWFDLFFGQPFQPLYELYGELNRCMDMVLVKEQSLLPEYRMKGIQARWFDQGVPDDYPACEHRDNPDFDVLVFGQTESVYEHRHKDVRTLLENGFSVAWASHGPHPDGVIPLEWTHPTQLPALMSRAKFVLSVDLRHDLERYWSDRFWMAVGAGACVLKRATVGDPEIEMIRYDELSADVMDRLRSMDMAERRKIGESARQTAMKDHTYGRRVQDLLNLVQSHPSFGRTGLRRVQG